MNLKAMRENNVQDLFRPHLSKKYEQNDQDILNIVCKGHVEIIPRFDNFQVDHFMHYLWGRKDPVVCFMDLFRTSTLHYTGTKKPWKSLECVASDTWWHYYKKSSFYEDSFYFKHQQDQIKIVRNDYHNRTNKQLFLRILANIKHRILK
jgi:lipopolysaccharide biosynthesis glycosyltransferase